MEKLIILHIPSRGGVSQKRLCDLNKNWANDRVDRATDRGRAGDRGWIGERESGSVLARSLARSASEWVRVYDLAWPDPPPGRRAGADRWRTSASGPAAAAAATHSHSIRISLMHRAHIPVPSALLSRLSCLLFLFCPWRHRIFSHNYY